MTPSLTLKSVRLNWPLTLGSVNEIIQLVEKTRQHGIQGSSESLTAEQPRIKDLEKENAHLREVNEIVQKVHLYFVKNASR